MTGGKQNPKILVKAVNWVGDAVLMTPALRGLRKKFPESYICLLVNSWVKDIFKENKDINEIIVYDKNNTKGLGKKIAFLNELKKKKFDIGIAVQPHSYEAALLLFFGGARERIGYSHYLRDLFLTRRIKLADGVKHDVDVFYDVFGLPVVSREDKKLILNTGQEAEKWAEGFLQEHGIKSGDKIVGLNPGAFRQAKRWHEERYAELSDEIAVRLKCRVIVFQGPGDEEVVVRVCAAAKEKLIVAETELLQLAALAKRCKLVVSNDTGPAHICAAVGTPLIVIAGTSDPRRIHPWGEGHITINKLLSCSPCTVKNCDSHACMKLITVKEVFDAVREKLKE